MDVSPAVKAYMRISALPNNKPKKQNKNLGLLSRSNKKKTKEESNEPIDRVRNYVASMRNAREQIKNG